MVSRTNAELVPRTICAWDRCSQSWLEMCELISAFPGALIPDSWPWPSYLWEGEQGLEREDLSQPVMFVRHSLESFHETQKNIKVMYADYEGIITSAHLPHCLPSTRVTFMCKRVISFPKIHDTRWINWKMSGDKLTCCVIISALEIKRIKIFFVF